MLHILVNRSLFLINNFCYRYRMVRFDREGFLDMGEFDPSLSAAVDIGRELKILPASPEESEYISAWESILTTCKVKDLHPGFVVVKLYADSFEDLDPDGESVPRSTQKVEFFARRFPMRRLCFISSLALPLVFSPPLPLPVTFIGL